MTKAQTLEVLQQLPEEFELEDIFERLLFIERLEQRLAQANRGEVVSFEEARARFVPKQPIENAA